MENEESLAKAVGRLEGSIETLTFMITRSMDMTEKWLDQESDAKEKLHERISGLDERLRGAEKKIYVIWIIGGIVFAITELLIGWLLSR